MLKLIQTSSLETIYPKREQLLINPLDSFSVLKGERFSYQIAFCDPDASNYFKTYTVSVKSDLDVTVYSEELVPATPTMKATDGNYTQTEPFLCPDVLKETNSVKIFTWYRSVLISVEGCNTPGNHEITVSFLPDNSIMGQYTDDIATETAEVKFNLTVLDAALPEQKLIYTNWFYADCIADYYKVETFSERHWELIESFMNAASRNGMIMILTPVLTPPLDTAIGHERPTTQLAEITEKDGFYSFNFSKLERWVKLAKKCGMKYLEINHLFTQWGAECAPKVVVNGEKRFGWHTKANSDEYMDFISQLLPALTKFLEPLWDKDKIYFHISDEPNDKHIDNYLNARKTIDKYLEGYVIMDALSNPKFYDSGAVTLPVPATNHIKEFLERDIKERWCYYCISQGLYTSNRFMCMPAYRNRSLGPQLFKANIAGFLHWGFNFYFNQYSLGSANPFFQSDAGGCFASGDSFVVYPGEDGAMESLRLVVFHENLQDLRAMQALSDKIGYEKTMEIIETALGYTPDFDKCAHSSEEILNMRRAINKKLAEIN